MALSKRAKEILTVAMADKKAAEEVAAVLEQAGNEALEAAVDALTTRVDDLETAVGDLETAVADHEGRITVLEGL